MRSCSERLAECIELLSQCETSNPMNLEGSKNLNEAHRSMRNWMREYGGAVLELLASDPHPPDAGVSERMVERICNAYDTAAMTGSVGPATYKAIAEQLSRDEGNG